ncbi:MAG TPA: hypothetical protein VK186_06475 [Candidatus Deferrimicrobium sp.]|nr:hypothetical protein [Candidatus Deferrimicrobium sp.]
MITYPPTRTLPGIALTTNSIFDTITILFDYQVLEARMSCGYSGDDEV